MIQHLPLRLPLLVGAIFLGTAFIAFKFLLGFEWLQSLDGAFASLAGARPQLVELRPESGAAQMVLIALAAAGFLVRIFLIAFAAAYLIRWNLQKNEMHELLKLLRVRSTSEETRESLAAKISHVN